jgi:hypothetical protein
VKQQALKNAVKGPITSRLHASPTSSRLCPLHIYGKIGYRNRIQNGPHIGLQNGQGSKVKPASQVNAAQSKQGEDKAAQKMVSNWRQLGPPSTDLTSSGFVCESRPGSFNAPPRTSWHLAAHVIPIGMTRERCVKPLVPDLTRWRGTSAPAGSHLLMVTQAPLKT